jgi:two-component system cit operon sensor histidine kinase CitA
MLKNGVVRKISQRLHNVSFQLRVFLLLLLTTLVILSAMERFLTYSFERYQFSQISTMAMNQAKMVAAMDSIVDGVKHRDKKKLAEVIEKMTERSDFSYIVIGDVNSIRLYHPYKEKIGYPLHSSLDNPDITESHFVTSEGSIGMAMRAKTPIYDENGKIIGVVSLGYLLSKIDNWRSLYSVPLMAFFAAVLGLLSFCSWFFSIHIKRQMRGMEPKDIVRVQRQQEALLGAVFEGLLAVDIDGNITAINQNARKMLNLNQPSYALIGKSVSQFVTPNTFFIERNGENVKDQICQFNGLDVIANRAAIWIDNVFQGWVVSFRSKNDINTLTAQLSQIQQYVENLRTLRHEHLNWMSTLSGLLQMKEYDRALNMVKIESSLQQSMIDSVRDMFKMPQVAALLFGKYHRAKELGLELIFLPGCKLTELEIEITEGEFAAIVGNLLDNAFDATLKNPSSNKRIELFLSDEGNEIILEIADTGCGIDDSIRENMFVRGISTKKEKNHGIGLYLVTTYVQQCGGTITIEDNSPTGTIFSIFIPKRRKTE